MTDLQFKSFLVLAEELNFTKASKRLNISQSTLSSHISSLEKNLGVTLFVRTNKNVILSPEGEHVYPFFAQAMEMIHRGVEEAKEIHEGHVNLMRVGFINGLQPEYMMSVKQILDDFCEQHHGLSLQMFAINEKEMIDMLENKKIDLAFTIDGIIRIKPEYKIVPIGKNPIRILYATDKFKFSEEVTLERLAEETMIVMSKEIAPSEEYILREFQEKMGVEFANVMRVNSNEARLFNIYSGKGIGFCDVATRSPYTGQMGQYYVDDFFVHYGFVYRNQSKNPVVRQFSTYVEEHDFALEIHNKYS